MDPDYFKDKTNNKRERENKEEANSSNKRRCDGSLSSMSTSSTGASRRSHFSESALHPQDGLLRCHVDRSICHLAVKPQMSKKQAYCQLHYWCTNERRYSNTAFCPNCNVVLCVDRCYELFHSEWYLHQHKHELGKKLRKK